MNPSARLPYSIFETLVSVRQLDLHGVRGPCFLLLSNGPGKNFLALGCEEEVTIKVDDNPSETSLKSKLKGEDWWFGYVAFEFKDHTEPVTTSARKMVSNHLLHFVKPQLVMEWEDVFQERVPVTVHTILSHGEALKKIEECLIPKNAPANPAIELEPAVDKQTYLFNAQSLMSHIQRGDVYEVNYCVDFFAEQTLPSPFRLFEDLNRNTSAPFSAYFKTDHIHVMCCSPESFLKKSGSAITMKPIKGTKPRGATEALDLKMLADLRSDPKEKAENIMIVDLVRNDLSKSSKPGSVRVEDLCGVYPFKTVWQMISTVSAQVDESIGLADLLNDCFPPGSMTGAPKISALKLIDQRETRQRGIYSGSIGYIRPGGDFELNVVIRSIIYDASKPLVSLSVGSALTAACSPEDEYEECLLKARALRKVIENEPVVQ